MPKRKLSDELARIRAAFGYSCDGLSWAWGSSPAFRTEVMLAAVMLPVAFWLDKTPVERAMLVCSVLAVLAAELLNCGIEAAIDRISPEKHPLSKAAKDVGSAAVLVCLVAAGAVWLLIGIR